MSRRPLIIGLTGSIGAGKSVTARQFVRLGARLFDADQTVHALLRPEGKAFAAVARRFPQALVGGKISRKRLGAIVFQNPEERRALEKIIHPLVWAERRAFLKKAGEEKAPVVLLEIPLLFETGEDKNVDTTICVTTRPALQKKRVLKRKNMTQAKFRAICAGQMPDAEKRRRADFVIETDEGFSAAKKQTRAVWAALLSRKKNERNRY